MAAKDLVAPIVRDDTAKPRHCRAASRGKQCENYHDDTDCPPTLHGHRQESPMSGHDAERRVRNPARYVVSGRIGVATAVAIRSRAIRRRSIGIAACGGEPFCLGEKRL